MNGKTFLHQVWTVAAAAAVAHQMVNNNGRLGLRRPERARRLEIDIAAVFYSFFLSFKFISILLLKVFFF